MIRSLNIYSYLFLLIEVQTNVLGGPIGPYDPSSSILFLTGNYTLINRHNCINHVKTHKKTYKHDHPYKFTILNEVI